MLRPAELFMHLTNAVKCEQLDLRKGAVLFKLPTQDFTFGFIRFE
jgi:hypothetical protein